MTVFEASQQMRIKFLQKYQDNEEGFSNFFLNCISDHRVKAFRYSQQRERYTGADWIWLVLSLQGTYIFLAQAKKIQGYHIRKSQAMYGKGTQIASLLEYSNKISAFPIYVLFSDRIRKTNCSFVDNSNTKEFVFFEPAQRVYDCLQEKKYSPPDHRPISCLFACYHRKCHYGCEIEDEFMYEDMCNACSKCKECMPLMDDHCRHPFEHLVDAIYGLSIKPHPLRPEFLFFSYAESIFLQNQNLLNYMVETYLGTGPLPIRNIIVSDYIGRHDDNLTKAIMGENFVIDRDTVLTREEITSALTKQWQNVADLICRIGIFGSYARLFAIDDMDTLDKNKVADDEEWEMSDLATCHSDVDIAIEYNVHAFTSSSDISRLYGFIRGTIDLLHKNIDFVDYLGAKSDISFINDIDSDMIWLSRNWEE